MRRLKMKVLLTLSILLTAQLTFPKKLIKGQVLDYYVRTPLSNVNILTHTGVLSDIDGRFEVKGENNLKISFSLSGYIDLIVSCTIDMDTLICTFYMISIKPFKFCIADGVIKHLFWEEHICTKYSRKMDKIWIKKRKVDIHTPLNWRLDCIEDYEFIEKQDNLSLKYQLFFCRNFYDYRKYKEVVEKDYIYCEIEN